MRTLAGTTAATQKDLASYRIVWLVEIDTETLAGVAATLRYATRAYSLSGDDYTAGLMPDGLQLGWAELRERCGLATVGEFRVALAAAGGLADTLAGYVLDNAPCRVYVVFVTGSETSADKVLMASGVVEDMGWDDLTVNLRCLDASDRDFREVPTHKVTAGEHPAAPFSEFGQVVPLTYGSYDGDYQDPAPCYAALRCMELFIQAYGTANGPTPSSNLYEWVEDANALARVASKGYYDADFEAITPPSMGPFVGPLSATRYLRLNASMKWLATNDVDSWRLAGDNDSSTYATVASGETLGLQWPGCGTPGTISHVYLGIAFDNLSPGTGDVEVYLGSDLLVSYTGSSGLLYEDIQTNLGDAWVEAWHVEALKVSIAPSGGDAVWVDDVYLTIHYTGEGQTDLSSPRTMFLSNVDGRRAATTGQHYVISGTSGSENSGPVKQLAAALSGIDLFDLGADAFDAAAWEAAYAARDGDGTAPYTFHFQLLEAVGWDFWDALCFEAGLHLYKNAAGEWAVIARDADADPVRFIGPEHIALQDPQDMGSLPVVSAKLTPTRDVVNEVVLRYDWDQVSQRHRKVSTRTAQTRYTGTCTVDSGAGTLTDAAASFLTGDYRAFAGDRVYVADCFVLVVTSVNSDTELGVELWDRDLGPLADVGSATDYYGGPGVSGVMVESWLRYKTVNPLGGIYDPTADQGGYGSNFLYGDNGDTAETVLDYLEAWYSQRRMVVELAGYLDLVDLELGDTCVLRCPMLPSTHDAEQAGALAAPAGSGDGSVTVTASGWPGGSAFESGDYIVVGCECLKVTGVAGEVLSVGRGELGSAAAAHTTGAAVYLCTSRWEVTGLQPVPGAGQVRVRLTEKPGA